MLTESERNRYLRPLDPIPTGLKPTGKPSANIRCLLFDIYGTLFVSGTGDIRITEKSPNDLQALENLLSAYGIGFGAKQTLERLTAAIRKRHAALESKGVDVPEVAIDQVWMNVLGFSTIERARDFAVRFELIANPVYPMPHARTVIDRCKQVGLCLGMVSNAQFYTVHLFDWFFHADPRALGFEPDLIILSYRLGCAKPSERLFLRAVRRLALRGISPQSTLYIGNDMLNDVYPAQKCGFQTALFAGDDRSLRLRRDHPLCRGLTADMVLTDLAQLFDIVPSLRRP